MIQKHRFYGQLSKERKKEVRDTLDTIHKKRMAQKQIFQECFIDSITRLNDMEKLVRQGQYSIDQYIKENERFGEWLKEMFRRRK